MIVLALLLAGGPVGLALSRDRPRATGPANTLADVARKAGCRLREYEKAPITNPPVSGRLVERAITTDSSYIGRGTPSVDATTHSLLHGRVLIQYQPGLPAPQVRALDQLVKDDPDRVVGFANQTAMTAPVAATAYLSLLTTQPQGLPGRPWFPHQVYAPGINTGYAAQFLPGIRDALEAGDAATVTTYRDLLLDSLRKATATASEPTGATATPKWSTRSTGAAAAAARRSARESAAGAPGP